MGLLYYSTNSWLSYIIAEQYYGHTHYAWCSPVFDATNVLPTNSTNPPTSTPKDIYWVLHEAVERKDRHSPKINENRTGIIRGAAAKLATGIITIHEEKEIQDIVAAADISDFYPLLFVMPEQSVRSIVKPVPINHRAHPLSLEYIIEALPRAYFDIMQWKR